MKKEIREAIDALANILPVVSEMEKRYREAYSFNVKFGDSHKAAHRKASAVVRREYPDFNAQAIEAGVVRKGNALLIPKGVAK